jgi:ribonuclease R
VLEAHGEATECQLIAEGKEKPTEPVLAQEVSAETVQPEAETYANELIVLNRLAKKLRNARFKCGAINFDREEVRFEIDEKGKPLSVYFKRAKDANKLVEEFMLLANRIVAESVGKTPKGVTPKVLPYRIHDVPDPTKLDNLAKLASRMGFNLRTEGSKTEVASSLNSFIAGTKGGKAENLVENLSLRAMSKARYSTENIGHYGLAFDYYTHFTSPIRRYPDTMVHRLLTRYEAGGKSASQKKYEALCEHSSSMEQLAAAAERASIKYKQVEFMADKIGQEFDAKISGVTEFGIYAEIDENKCEGLIQVRFLGDEAFDYDDRNYRLVGRKTHHTFTLGDPIRIKVASANLYRKQLDYEFVKKLTDDDSESVPFFKNFVYSDTKKAKGKGKKGKSRKRSK